MNFRETLLVVLGLFLTIAPVVADSAKEVLPFSISDAPPQKISHLKKGLVQDGITLGKLAALFGKGWEGRWDNVGIISWHFDDGSVLCVLPKESKVYNEIILTFSGSNESSKMWWLKN